MSKVFDRFRTIFLPVAEEDEKPNIFLVNSRFTSIPLLRSSSNRRLRAGFGHEVSRSAAGLRTTLAR
jgi:hypothetical protein